MNCALAGAEHVVSVDVSELALEQAQRNAERTGVKNVEYVQSDVFDLLTELAESKRGKYDLVIHCGGCMLNSAEMQHRMQLAIENGIPFTPID